MADKEQSKKGPLSSWIANNLSPLTTPTKRRPIILGQNSEQVNQQQTASGSQQAAFPSYDESKNKHAQKMSPTNPKVESVNALKRTKSLVRSERRMDHLADQPKANILQSGPERFHPWMYFSWMVTCCIPNVLLVKIGGMANPQVQQAWREKIALVFICVMMMSALGFITFGLQNLICTKTAISGLLIKWPVIQDTTVNQLMVFNNVALNMRTYLRATPMNDMVRQLVVMNLGKDATKAFAATPELRRIAEAFVNSYKAGTLDGESMGCIVSEVILYVSLIIILSVIIIRFTLAVFFQWFISRQLGKLRENRIPKLQKSKNAQLRAESKKAIVKEAKSPSAKSFKSINAVPQSEYTEEVYTLMLVTCYSEGQEGIKTTMDSLANTIYNDSKKLMFVVADGQITGSGNAKTTPDLILELLEIDNTFPCDPMSYEAIAEGSKRHNMARVHVGFYNYNGHRVPTILVNKCGTPAEADGPKPGNRGKRDSQIILMSFFKKVIFDEPMTALEYDLFTKMQYLMDVTPDRFEIILMVDADTRVEPDSLSRMVACMVRDPLVIGLCGETRIMNKNESWVSRIQVFEYYLSHHLQKTFESIFGGVTCLPGCFCMWRIKAKKPNGYWVPILCNPDIVETYSENVVDTLHKKNLLLLGEDRFLTTIMLRAFPRRKTMFVPSAFCKTTVPAEFAILLSQRRRWINSTIHNLMELVLVRELCGTFCFSMQFVIFLELVGTVTLPAAITFTIYLVIIAILGPVIPWIPLFLLVAILGLPAVLIMLTTRRISYVYWLFVYLLALPIWNFLLPAYAFWHFDDFSWGQTRKVEGEKKGDGHGEGDGKTSIKVLVKKWIEWEKERSRPEKGTRTQSYIKSDDSSYTESPKQRTTAFPDKPTVFTGNYYANSNRHSFQSVGTPKLESPKLNRNSMGLRGAAAQNAPGPLSSNSAARNPQAQASPSLRMSLGLSFSELFKEKK